LKVLLLKGRSGYEATRLFIDEVAAAFRRRGDEARILDLAPEDQELAYIAGATAGQRFDLVFSIGLFGELISSEGLGVGDVVGAPLVVQYVDYPLSHYERLAETPSNVALLVVDPSHVDAVRSVYGADFPNVAFSPHGAIGEPQPVEADPDAYAAARDIPILFAGTFYKPGAPLWANLDGPTRRVFDTAVEIALAAEFVPALEALDQALDRVGGHLSEAKRGKLRINAFAVHERVRQHRRFEMLKTAAKAGLPVTLVGAGYEKDLYRFRSMTHVGERDLDEVTRMMGRARMVLNVNANFGRGSHERPLSAMLAGAVAVTDHSAFYEAAFGEGAIVQLRWTSLAWDLEGVGRLLDDPARLHAIAANGQAKALAAHRWDHRLDAIVAAADAARLTPEPRR
jgi:hypothetical protein